MTNAERAVLDGRLFAAEMAVQGLFTIIVNHLPDGPTAVHNWIATLDAVLLAYRGQAEKDPYAKVMREAARASLENLREQLEKFPAMQPPPPGAPAP